MIEKEIDDLEFSSLQTVVEILELWGGEELLCKGFEGFDLLPNKLLLLR